MWFRGVGVWNMSLKMCGIANESEYSHLRQDKKPT